MNEALFLGMTINALVSIGGLIVLFRKLSGAVETRRIEPQPLIVQKAEDYMTKAACEQMHVHVEKFEQSKFAAIEQRLADLTVSLEARNERGEERAALIHQRINTVSDLLREEKGKLEQHIRSGGHRTGDGQ